MVVDVPRFWLALGADVRVEDHGFLRDPPRFGAREQIVSIADLDRPGAVVLVGEPGMGKTTSLRALEARLQTRRAPDEEVQLVDLGATGLEAQLRESVFGTAEYARWCAGDGVLHLLLDGFDEARLRVETVADLLLAGLKDVDRSRLRLVVACRSGDRHQTFEDELAKLFDQEPLPVYELLPLRREDVAAIADDAGVPSEAFLRDVDYQGVGALAARPITLRLLLSIAADGQGLAGSPIDLYYKGCRAWAAEHDEDRRRGVVAGSLDVGARLAVAERVAAAVVLSGRVGVHVDESSVADDDHVALVALVGGTELRAGAVRDIVAVDEAAVRETLCTALFTARAHRRFAFVHQTVAEFLAASYLATRMRPAQMLDLVTLREGNALTLVPQLREVVRWLCGLSPEVLLAVLAIDPEVALGADLLSSAPEHAAAVVDGLLMTSIGSSERRELVRSLQHPGMEQQLAAVLDDRAAAPRRRQRAIELAVIRRLSGLAGRIADLALDPAEPSELRAAAAGALGWGSLWLAESEPPLASDVVRRRLLPLAFRTVDAPEMVRAAALRALLFDLVEPEEVFAALTPQSGERLWLLDVGWELPRVIFRPPDGRWRVAALDWLAGLPPYAHRPSDPLFASVEELLIDSWEHRADPAVHAALVRLVTRLLGDGRLLVTGQTLRDETDWAARSAGSVRDVLRDRDGRRVLVNALIGALADGRIEAAAVVGSTPSLLDAEDREWLGEQAAVAGQDDARRAAWRSLAEVLDARERRPPLPARQRPIPPGVPPPDVVALVADDLARFDAGDLDAFWRLGEHLALDEDDPLTPGPWAMRTDLRRFPGWVRLDEVTRERVVDAAWCFLHEKDPQASGWLTPGLPWAPAMAGLRALHVLGTDLVRRLGNEVWERWAPAIMAWPQGARFGVGIYPTLCLVCAPSAGTDAFLEVLDRAVAQSGRAWPLDRLRLFDRELLSDVLARLERPLLDRVCDPHWPPLARGAALEFLLLHWSEQARAVVGTLLDAAALVDPRGRVAQLELAQVLVEHTDDASWMFVWPLMVADAAFGHELLRRLSRPDQPAGGRLDPEEVVALATWLDHHPPTADQLERWSQTTTAGRWLPSWFRATVQQLANTGTPEALEALGRIPGDWRWERNRARDLARRARWRPPRPADVVRLGADRARRWVLTDAELREVLVEALERAQTALQAATPAATDLWDTTARRPKHENEISDWLARWLRSDLRGRGIVIGREVQIRPGPRGRMGEAGDLVVDAVAADRTAEADVVTVTIEVKGCWRPEVKTALRTQLVKRYLLAANRRQGIYIVAWFPRDPWDKADHRRRDARHDLDQLRALLAAQAQAASAECDVEVDAIVLDCSPPTAPAAGTKPSGRVP